MQSYSPFYRPPSIPPEDAMFFRYQIVRRIGRGGMGEVYEAFDTRLRRSIALKILTTGGQTHDELRHLLLEARALAAIRHPNVVTVYDVGEHDGVPYLAMELLQGRSLGRILKAGEEISRAEKLRWLLEIARALATVHRAGIVHRDVKPSNVIIADDGRVVLFDFGIARQAEPNVATYDGQSVREGFVIGTPRYMAPELMTGTRASSMTDQYAWGVIAAQLLTGSAPSPSDDVARSLAAARVPRDLAALVVRAVDPRPLMRFSHMDELVAALEPLLAVRRTSHATKVAIVAGLSLLVGAIAGAATQRPWERHVEQAAPSAPVVTSSATTSASASSATTLVPLGDTVTTTAATMTAIPTTTAPAATVQHFVAPARECSVDDDCACGISKSTGICAVGPRGRIDTAHQCPDYCQGFEGNLTTTCRAGRCVKAPRFSGY